MADTHGLLLATLGRCEGPVLMVADENCLDFPFAAVDRSVRILSNRFDVATAAGDAGLRTRFSDFDFSALADADIHNVVYRVSKEKPVVHHVANGAGKLVPEGGTLWLLGAKQDGIKTFGKTIGRAFGDVGSIGKEGALYRAGITRRLPAPETLDDRDYTRIRSISTLDERPVYSKPGIFGWDRIDRGSGIMADYLPTFLTPPQPDHPAILDLGCGYGYLSLMAARLGRFSFTATDNCAAAIAACRENFRVHGIEGEVIADDCGTGLHRSFDFILCNPPFHQGFRQDRRLTEKFLAATQRLLAKTGHALFVVNEFVPLESPIVV